MSPVAIDSKQLIKDYFQAMSSQPKTEELMNRFITDPGLKEHIRQCSAAFPDYEVIPQQMVAEGDTVAVRCTFHGIHKGEFAGIPATGRPASSDFMIFYRIEDGRIAEHWITISWQDIVSQLTA